MNKTYLVAHGNLHKPIKTPYDIGILCVCSLGTSFNILYVLYLFRKSKICETFLFFHSTLAFANVGCLWFSNCLAATFFHLFNFNFQTRFLWNPLLLTMQLFDDFDLVVITKYKNSISIKNGTSSQIKIEI